MALPIGSPETWFAYHKAMPALAEAGYTVLAIDLRGAGASAIPPSGYDAATIVAALRALPRELGLEGPVDLVAYDITGGWATPGRPTTPRRCEGSCSSRRRSPASGSRRP